MTNIPDSSRPDATPENGAAPEGEDRPRPTYGEYGPPSAAGATPSAPTVAPSDVTGSAAESLGGVGAFVGGSYPQVVATYTKYEDAQAAVDRLSDEGFPVQNVSIVGHDIRTVENVSGRMTNGKAALRGVSGGAWFGLLVGLLFSFFVPHISFIGVIILAIVLGGLWGALFGFVGHAAQRGTRDFSSVKTMEAGRYELLVRAEFSARAMQMLSSGTYR